jgi:CHASE3 domain sensor protein
VQSDKGIPSKVAFVKIQGQQTREERMFRKLLIAFLVLGVLFGLLVVFYGQIKLQKYETSKRQVETGLVGQLRTLGFEGEVQIKSSGDFPQRLVVAGLVMGGSCFFLLLLVFFLLAKSTATVSKNVSSNTFFSCTDERSSAVCK